MKIISFDGGKHRIFVGTKEELESSKKDWEGRVEGFAQWDDNKEDLFVNKDYSGPGRENVEILSWICSDITPEIIEEVKKEIGVN